MRKPTLPNASYTFADYFKINPPIDQLAAYFGYEFRREKYLLPRSGIGLDRLEDLKLRLDENVLHTTLGSEIRRSRSPRNPLKKQVVFLQLSVH
jgi:hypothetical protein